MILQYDGSFEGYLSLVYDVYYDTLPVTSICKTSPSTFFFEPYREIFTDEQKAHKVLQSLRERFTPQHFQTICHVFLCDTVSFEMALLHFIQIGYKNQEALENINNTDIFFMRRLEKELLTLVHKMYGFVRFEKVQDGSLYAKIETKYNILPFLGEHFYRRLGTIPFIIHDVKRALAYVQNNHTKTIRSVASFNAPIYADDEKQIKALWKAFFKSAGIEARLNPKLQRHWVPLLYRTYMSEFEA